MGLDGGATNSRRTDKFGTPSEAGIDTLRLRWRTGSENYERFRRATPHETGARGEVWAKVGAGYRAGVYPDGLAYVEARLAVLVDGSTDSHRLAGPSEVASGVAAATNDLEELGLDFSVPAIDGDGVLAVGGALGRRRVAVVQAGAVVPEVGRIDLASELRFVDPDEGRGLMEALGRIDVPWAKRDVVSHRAGVESVAWRAAAGHSVLLRAYDKGVESGSDEPGLRLRLERQHRSRKGRAMLAADVTQAELRRLYLGRELRAIADSAQPVTVCSSWDAIALVDHLVETGEMKAPAADTVRGFLAGTRRRADYPLRTWARRWAQLRELGIAIDEHRPSARRIDVPGYLDGWATAWAA